MPSKQARNVLRYLDSHDRITEAELKNQFSPKYKSSLLEDLCEDGYIKEASGKYVSVHYSPGSNKIEVKESSPRLGEDTPFRLTDRGRSYLRDYRDKFLDKWFTRGISILALLASFLAVAVSALK